MQLWAFETKTGVANRTNPKKLFVFTTPVQCKSSQCIVLHDVIAHLLRRRRKRAGLVVGQIYGAHKFLVPFRDRNGLYAVGLHRRDPRHDRHAKAKRYILNGAVALAHLKDEVEEKPRKGGSCYYDHNKFMYDCQK